MDSIADNSFTYESSADFSDAGEATEVPKVKSSGKRPSKTKAEKASNRWERHVQNEEDFLHECFLKSVHVKTHGAFFDFMLDQNKTEYPEEARMQNFGRI